MICGMHNIMHNTKVFAGVFTAARVKIHIGKYIWMS